MSEAPPPSSGLTMERFRRGLDIQRRVIQALLVRELTTRFGRENIGFLWMMAEPLLFAGLVGMIWTISRGGEEHGISMVAFVATGYIPLTLFRNGVNRAVGVFAANTALMYHRQIKIVDFVLTRFLIEMAGAMMAYLFIGIILWFLGYFPVPEDFALLGEGWLLYAFFSLAVCMVLAPLSEMSHVIEKFVPVTVYVMIPFSGTFTMSSWLPPKLRDVVSWSPAVNGMEMMRSAIFGAQVRPYYELGPSLAISFVLLGAGLVLCRRMRRILVVE